MLAQNFKSAADLGITPPELRALTQVLGMLERGDLVDAVTFFEEGNNKFHMGTSGECGTPACIGGWAAELMHIGHIEYLERYGWRRRDKNMAIHELFWNETACELPATVAQAATALRSYLTTGEASWDLALVS